MIKAAGDSELLTATWLAIPTEKNNVLMEEIVRLVSSFPLAVESILMDYLQDVASDGRVFARNIKRQSRFRKRITVETYLYEFFDELDELVLMLKIEQQKQLNREMADMARTVNNLGRDVYALGKREIAGEVERQAQAEGDQLTGQQQQQAKVDKAGKPA
jgi:hypothetical protein